MKQEKRKIEKEIFEHLPFGRGEVDTLITRAGSACGKINIKPANSGWPAFVTITRSAQNRPDSGDQFANPERLGDIIVGTSVESLDNINLAVANRADDNGQSHAGAAPQFEAFGAIAVGHPLGASGARLALTTARQLQRSGGRYAVISLCIGMGQGLAVVIENTNRG